MGGTSARTKMSHRPEIGKVLNQVNYWQFHFGGEGGFKLGELLAISFWGGRGGDTSAGRSVNFDSFSEIGYRSP